ncbi:hypothetical protein MP638_004483, partial [Amoeboaphelidium occidentale]
MTAVKRILGEIKELSNDTNTSYTAQPLEDNIFEWHFTLLGPPDTEFEGGIYHGRILLPAEYPFKPPSVIFLTPNGRFETNKKICLTITGHHPEYWQPAWGIRTAVLAIVSFFPTKAEGAVGGLDWSKEERKALALKSREWTCSSCCKKNSIIMSEKSTRVAESSGQCTDNGSSSKSEDLSMFTFSYEKDTKSNRGSTTNLASNDGASQAPIQESNVRHRVAHRSSNGSEDSNNIDQSTSSTAAPSTPKSKAAPTTQITARSRQNNQRNMKYVDFLLAVVLLFICIVLLRRFLVM